MRSHHGMGDIVCLETGTGLERNKVENESRLNFQLTEKSLVSCTCICFQQNISFLWRKKNGCCQREQKHSVEN